MSSMIGERSGNRGRCAGCCRKIYSLQDKDSKEIIRKGYLLSMKDLNTSKNMDQLDFVDSYKIEGRMKEANYVANVTRAYRQIIDGNKIDPQTLNKVFNRTYTKGFMLGESSDTITNIQKPNNYGYYIGNIIRNSSTKIWLKLSDTLNKGDQIRVDTNDLEKEISIPVTKMFDEFGNEITSGTGNVSILSNIEVKAGAKVYKTKDIISVNEAEQSLSQKEYKKLPINIKINIHINKPIELEINYLNFNVKVSSDEIVQKAQKHAICRENVLDLLKKLNDTPYKINEAIIDLDNDSFISLKSINDVRRKGIEKLNILRLERKVILSESNHEITPKKYQRIIPEITVEVITQEQYEKAKELGIKHIYYKNIVRRNNAKYIEPQEEMLVGGLGGIQYYKDKRVTLVSDYSLNVTNATSVALLSSLGVDRITLSEEISKDNIQNLIDTYVTTYHTNPNLELIIYGRSKLMHTHYCPLKRLGRCGDCKSHRFVLKDDFATFPLFFNGDCTITILNSKTLNIIDELDQISGVNYYRLRFTTESADTMEQVIKLVKKKLNGELKSPSFDYRKETKGHFIKNPQ